MRLAKRCPRYGWLGQIVHDLSRLATEVWPCVRSENSCARLGLARLSLECTAGSLVCSLGSLIVRFCKQTLLAGAFLFKHLLDFLICFVKLVSRCFLFERPSNFSCGFLESGLRLLPLFFRLCSCQTVKYLLQHGLKTVFHPGVTKSVQRQLRRLGTFPLGSRLEGKGDFAAYQPTISTAVRTGHHSAV